MRGWAWLVMLAACGRVGFDPLGGDGGGGGGTSDALTLGDGGAVIPAGLVVWYGMEEDFFKTGVTSDFSGHGLDAGCTLCPTLGQGHKTGSLGAHFNGSFMYFYRPATAALNLAAYTVATWVYPERMPSVFEILVGRAFGTTTDNSFALDLDMNLRVEFFSQGADSVFSATSLQLMQWAHVAITWDGTTKRVYVAGVQSGMGVPATGVTYDTHDMLLGVDSSDGSLAYYFQGNLDDVMVFDRALSTAEIATLASN